MSYEVWVAFPCSDDRGFRVRETPLAVALSSLQLNRREATMLLRVCPCRGPVLLCGKSEIIYHAECRDAVFGTTKTGISLEPVEVSRHESLQSMDVDVGGLEGSMSASRSARYSVCSKSSLSIFLSQK
jgi:hypothetical protein